MLALVFSYVDIQELKDTILNIPISVIIIVVGIYVVGQFVSSLKWWLIASNSVKASYGAALRAYFIGMYCNCFGLGTVGGDVARGLILSARGKGVKTEALASVIADRAHGLAVLSLIGILSVFALEHDRIDFSFKIILFVGALLIMFGWLIGPKIILALTPKHHRLRDKIERTLLQFPKDPAKLTVITILSVIFHCIQIFANGYMAHALGANITWSKIFASIPFVNIAGTLPISWQGLGVRESSLMFFLGNEISSEQAIAMGALWFAAVTVSGAIGGILAFISGDLGLVAKDKNQGTLSSESL